MNNNKNCWTVYCHTTPSGKRYIGITSQKPEERWRNGRGYIKDTPFGKAIEKYGWDEIKHEILDTNLDEFTAKCLEEYYIFSYQTYVGFKDCKGYNCTLGGEGTVGCEPWNKGQTGVQVAWNKGQNTPEETRKKISSSNIGKPSNRKGTHHTEESRRKISESKKGKTPWMKGKHHTEESRRKISESKKGKTPWNKGKKGKPHTEEEKNKISESNKGKHHNKETKKILSEKHKGDKNPMYGKPSHNKGKHLVMIDGKRHYE